MLSWMRNLLVVCPLLLLSGCFLSHGASRLTDEDAGSRSVDGDELPADGGDPLLDSGDFSVDGGDLSVNGGDASPDEDDNPLVDAGTEEPSLLGIWWGSLFYSFIRSEGTDVTGLSGLIVEFTDTEFIVSMWGNQMLRGSYSADSVQMPHQVDIDISHSAGTFPLQGVYEIEDNALLTIVLSTPLSSSRPQSFILESDASTVMFELFRLW